MQACPLPGDEPGPVYDSAQMQMVQPDIVTSGRIRKKPGRFGLRTHTGPAHTMEARIMRFILIVLCVLCGSVNISIAEVSTGI
jgi:hypothetical protein